MNIDNILLMQNEFFKSGKTINIEFRKEMLRKLYKAIEEKEAEIVDALYKDLGKSETEAYMCEIGMTLSEITYMMKNIKKLSGKRKVKTPLAQFKSKSYEIAEPYGNVLIMSPWNYPFLLTMDPLVTAIAAGNTAVVKPSAYSPNTSAVINGILSEIYSKEYVAVVTGGRNENATLLEKKFDFIFFTGGATVGKLVLSKAANNLTPVVLELGGKSPCIVDSSANIKLAARRIVFGKFINCGQTCVAPDYILCDLKIKNELIKEIGNEIKKQYSDNVLNNKDYGKIINQKHFARLLGLIDKNKVVYGGDNNEEKLQIAPTIMDNVTWDDKVMQEEIFGPILPVLSYDDFNEVYNTLKDKEKPLALYLFSEDKNHIDFITHRCIYGGGCINDTIIHLATSQMGFGGVGESGMGSYHGKKGFDTFSHIKSIVDKKTWIDLPMRYQPYKKKSKKLIKMFLK